jgi:hypothetical protein
MLLVQNIRQAKTIAVHISPKTAIESQPSESGWE